MTLGLYENFPPNIHFVQSFHFNVLPAKQLQQKLIQVLYEVNKKEFSFEEAGNPTIPDCKIIFEFGLADAESFNYIDEEEVKKTLDLLAKQPLDTMDFFCVHPLLQGQREKKRALKFDYYLLQNGLQ